MASWCFSSSDISNDSTAEQILMRFLVTETAPLNIMCSFRRNQGDPGVEVEASPDSYQRNPVCQKFSVYTATILLHLQPFKLKSSAKTPVNIELRDFDFRFL
jgi:hypothetical protein